MITSYNNVIFGKAYGITKQNLWDQLASLGIITSIGMIDLDVLNDASVLNTLRSWGLYGCLTGQEDRGFNCAFKNPELPFSIETGRNSSDPFENALLNFDTLTEELLVGLTVFPTPIYANPEINSAYTFLSPYVIGGYQKGADNSLFIRIDHQKLQQTMSRFFTLQNTISAYMTVAFSIADMVFSIAASWAMIILRQVQLQNSAKKLFNLLMPIVAALMNQWDIN